jgi:hypothetical protein
VAGVRRVLLRDGAAVTVRGATKISLHRPTDLPSLSLGRFAALAMDERERDSAAGLLHLATGLRAAAVEKWNGTAASSPALVAFDLELGADGALLAAPLPSRGLHRLRARALTSGVLELTPRDAPLGLDASRALALAGNTPYVWPLRSVHPDHLLSYERLLREVLASQVFGARLEGSGGGKDGKSGAQAQRPDIPLRLHETSAEAVTFLRLEVEVERKEDAEVDDVEQEEEGRGSPDRRELLLRRIAGGGRKTGHERWRALVRVEGSGTSGMRFKPLKLDLIEETRDGATLSPAVVMEWAGGNVTASAGEGG